MINIFKWSSFEDKKNQESKNTDHIARRLGVSHKISNYLNIATIA